MCKSYKHWSSKEEQILFDCRYESLTTKQKRDLAETMGRTYCSLQGRWAMLKTRKVVKPTEAPKSIIVDSTIIDAIVGKATSATMELGKNQVTFYF